MGEIGIVKKPMYCLTVEDARDILHGLNIAAKSVGPKTHDRQRIDRHMTDLKEFIAMYGKGEAEVGD